MHAQTLYKTSFNYAVKQFTCNPPVPFPVASFPAGAPPQRRVLGNKAVYIPSWCSPSAERAWEQGCIQSQLVLPLSGESLGTRLHTFPGAPPQRRELGNKAVYIPRLLSAEKRAGAWMQMLLCYNHFSKTFKQSKQPVLMEKRWKTIIMEGLLTRYDPRFCIQLVHFWPVLF